MTCYCIHQKKKSLNVFLLIQTSAAKKYQCCSLQTRWICRRPCLRWRSHRCCVWRKSQTNPGTSGKIYVKTGFTQAVQTNIYSVFIFPLFASTCFITTRHKWKKKSFPLLGPLLSWRSFLCWKKRTRMKLAETSHHHSVLPHLQFKDLNWDNKRRLARLIYSPVASCVCCYYLFMCLFPWLIIIKRHGNK